MLIRLQATEWSKSDAISWDGFFEYLASRSNRSGRPVAINFDRRERNFWIQKSGDFWAVLFFTIRDHKKYCEKVEEEDGTIRMNIHRLTAGTSAADFNYFLCHRETGKGVYAYYHHSCAFIDFTRFCRSFYKEMKEDLVAQHSAQLRSKNSKLQLEKSLNRARSHFSGNLSGKLLITPRELAELVSQFKKIKRLELTFGTVQVSKKWGEPLRDLVKTDRQTFSFKPHISQNTLRGKIVEAVDLAKVTRGKIVGDMNDGHEHIFHLSRNAGVFEELEYDEIVEDLEFNLADIADCILVQKMQESINTRPDYFIRG